MKPGRGKFAPGQVAKQFFAKHYFFVQKPYYSFNNKKITLFLPRLFTIFGSVSILESEKLGGLSTKVAAAISKLLLT